MSKDDHSRNAYKVLVRLKNQKEVKICELDEVQKKYSLTKALLSMVSVASHWAIIVLVGALHIFHGEYYVGGLLLFFHFVGGFFVTIYLHVLTSRFGDKEFKDEIARSSQFLLCLSYIPSFLPFFSAGLSIHLIRRLRKAKDETEIIEIVHLIDICEKRLAIEKIYESSLSAFPLGVTKMVLLLEQTSFKVMDAFLLLSYLSARKEASDAPMKLAKVFNGHDATFMEIVAGVANKGVTMLSFAFWITASRRYFADLEIINTPLLIATVLPAIVVLLVADCPGICAFILELRQLLKKRTRTGRRYLLDSITLLVPLLGVVFWVWVMVFEKHLLYDKAFIIATAMFFLEFSMSMLGLCYKQDLPWLGQFSADILLLCFIASESFFHHYKFQDIDFEYVPEERKALKIRDSDRVGPV